MEEFAKDIKQDYNNIDKIIHKRLLFEVIQNFGYEYELFNLYNHDLFNKCIEEKKLKSGLNLANIFPHI